MHMFAFYRCMLCNVLMFLSLSPSVSPFIGVSVGVADSIRMKIESAQRIGISTSSTLFEGNGVLLLSRVVCRVMYRTVCNSMVHFVG